MTTLAVNPAKVASSDAFRALHDAIEAAVDVIQREYDGYRASDLRGPAEVVYGDPFKIRSWPTFAVVPETGEFEEIACGGWRGTDRIQVRVYWATLEQAGSANVYPELVRTIDALTLLFVDYPTLADAEGSARVSRVRIVGRDFGLVEESRGSRDLYTRTAELTLEVKGFAWRP